ncbi:MAG: heavy-metal-associated domain-containing protein, partial [Actinobacteria bacterium]|nr:heavy-metal-associated domain-containing protein [Actinomycetota bacterium]
MVELNSEIGVPQVDLAVAGMTCNACALKIERALNSIAGVHAVVNYATESARVSVSDSTIRSERLISVVEELGYGARLLEEVTPDMLDAEVRD